MKNNSFSRKPDIEFDQDNIEKPFQLRTAVKYRSNEYYGHSYYVEIEKDYDWNGANIPRPFWSLIGFSPTDPQVAEASMVHDKLCENKNIILKSGVGTSSQIFRDILIINGVKKSLADRMMRAVWAFQVFQKGWAK